MFHATSASYQARSSIWPGLEAPAKPTRGGVKVGREPHRALALARPQRKARVGAGNVISVDRTSAIIETEDCRESGDSRAEDGGSLSNRDGRSCISQVEMPTPRGSASNPASLQSVIHSVGR